MVYVDELRDSRVWMVRLAGSKWRYPTACHLWADLPEELKAFSAKLGLKKSWYQPHALVPHYDLTSNKRRQAIEAGAVELPMREWLRTVRSRGMRCAC